MLKTGVGKEGLNSLLEQVLGQLLGTTYYSVVLGRLNGKKGFIIDLQVGAFELLVKD